MVTPELIKYIKNSIAIGESQDVVMAKLMPKGWAREDIEEAYGVITGTVQTKTRSDASVQGVKMRSTPIQMESQLQRKRMSIGDYLKMYAPSVVRYAMSLVVLWFGIQQFIDTSSWLAYVPDSAVAFTHLNATVLVYLNGTIEVVFGTLLMFGWKTRWVALILALHLFDIMYIVGYGEIGVRDFGLAMALFTIFMNGPDVLSFDPPYAIA